MPKSAVQFQWLPNRTIMGREFSHEITNHLPKLISGFVGRNTTAFSHRPEIACDLNINLSGEASICHTDAVYTKAKSGLFGPLILQAQVTVVDHKKQGIPKG